MKCRLSSGFSVQNLMIFDSSIQERDMIWPNGFTGLYLRWFRAYLECKNVDSCFNCKQNLFFPYHFHRNGIVMDESEYIGTQIFATDEHCLATKIEDNYKWVPIYFLRNKLLSVTRFIKVVLCYFVNLLISCLF